jgi:hypothetical protein
LRSAASFDPAFVHFLRRRRSDGGSQPPALFIRDEPTNHLNLDSIEAIDARLAAYDRALLVVSHDEKGADRRLQLGEAAG